MLYANEAIAILVAADAAHEIGSPEDPMKVSSRIQALIEGEQRDVLEAITALREILHQTKMSKGKGSHEAMDRFLWFQSQGRPKLQLILSRLEYGLSDENEGSGSTTGYGAHNGGGNTPMA